MKKEKEFREKSSAGSPAAGGKPSFRVVDKRHWKQETQAGGGDAAPEDAGPERQPAYVEELERRLEERDEQLRRTVADCKRAIEEAESSTIRLRKEAAREIEKGRSLVLYEMLEIVDNFDRALEALAGNPSREALIEGIRLIHAQLIDKLGSFGVRRMASLGMKFDPAVHEVVSEVPVDEEANNGVVVGVVREGYRAGDTLLRPATVAVGAYRPAEPRRD
jgi:molecular chaperone GrpE